MMLESRNVFVDTQVFVQNRFQFEQPQLKKLLELGASEKLQLVLTEPVVGEVEAKLREQAAEVIKAYGQFRKNLGFMEQLFSAQHPGLIVNISEEDIFGCAIEAWKTYLKDPKAIILPASDVDSSELLGFYFDAKAPFSGGKKKSEFPDAISVLSLAAWMKKTEQKPML